MAGAEIRVLGGFEQIRIKLCLTLSQGAGSMLPVMEGNDLLIGEVAARSGLSRKALRLYEARGILPPPHR